MVDVTVDAKPMAHAPYDPNDIPEAVRNRAKAVESLYGPDGKMNGSGGSRHPNLRSRCPGLTTVSRSGSAGADDTGAASRPTFGSAGTCGFCSASPGRREFRDLEDRFLAMQGRNTATQKTIGEMQEQMTQLGNELMHAQQHRQPRRQQAPQQQPPPSYLTEQDVQNYGSDLIDVDPARGAAGGRAAAAARSSSRTPSCASSWRSRPGGGWTRRSRWRCRIIRRSTAIRAGTGGC